MSPLASQRTRRTIVYSTVYSRTYQRKPQMFPFDDAMVYHIPKVTIIVQIYYI